MNFKADNLLIISFGQIGDVILSLPAIESLKRKFSDSSITLLVGTSARGVVELLDENLEIIDIDRVALRDGNKLRSILDIARTVRDIRKRNFDFVIDLHSLPETNLLGFLSGAKHRLFANRDRRSIDFLSNFRPKPGKFEESGHMSDFYMNCLEPLGIKKYDKNLRILPSESIVAKIKKTLQHENNEKLVGLQVGAGNSKRLWDLAKFSEVARRLSDGAGRRVLVFYGPEEWHMSDKIEAAFPDSVSYFSKLSLTELAAAYTQLELLIGNDTGPMHLATAVGTPVLILTNPSHFRPLGERVHYVKNEFHTDISADDVIAKALTIMG